MKFQKTLALYAGATNHHEAMAAEAAARRLMAAYGIDPVRLNNKAFYSDDDFTGNVLLETLRSEWKLRPEYIAAERRRQNRSAGQQARRAREFAARMEKMHGMFDDVWSDTRFHWLAEGADTSEQQEELDK
jgi:hypothetical protein